MTVGDRRSAVGATTKQNACFYEPFEQLAICFGVAMLHGEMPGQLAKIGISERVRCLQANDLQTNHLGL